MLRYLAGVASALLLMAAGFFIWKSRAEQQDPIPPAPTVSAAQFQAPRAPLEIPPEAPEKSREEKRFDRADKDKDGRITQGELLEPRRKAFAKLDANGDGRLGFEEWAVSTVTKFAKADQDRSRFLSRAEFATTKAKAKAKARCSC